MDRHSRIEEKLRAALAPVHLDIRDESHRHAVPPGAESHFKVVAVASGFAGQSPIQRHRRIQALLADELNAGLHALTLHAWTPEEWLARSEVVPESPPCRGGSSLGRRDALSPSSPSARECAP